MTQIVYARTRVAKAEGRVQKNPRNFIKPVAGATKVFIDGDWPNIAAAYEAAGVPVSPIEEMRALPRASKAKADRRPEPMPASGSDAAKD